MRYFGETYSFGTFHLFVVLNKNQFVMDKKTSLI